MVQIYATALRYTLDPALANSSIRFIISPTQESLLVLSSGLIDSLTSDIMPLATTDVVVVDGIGFLEASGSIWLYLSVLHNS